MKNKIFNILIIVSSLLDIPMWFVKRYEYHQLVAGDEPDTLKELIHHYSMMDCLGHTILPYLSIALLIASVVLNIVVLKHPRLQKYGVVIAVVALGFYWVLRKYAFEIYFG